MDAVGTIQPWELADIIRCKIEKVLIVDARTFCEYNTSHIVNSVNVWSSKIRKKRLQQNNISVHDFLQQACHISLQEIKFDEVVVYDQSATFPHLVPLDTFLHILLLKLSSSFSKVSLLQGGFLEFQSQFYEMCEDSSQKSFLLTSFSQPCLPITNTGPTKILPFLFLGSQHDANNKQQLFEHNISYELNVSTSCPKPDFLQDSHFLRIAVNDNFSAKLLPHFAEAFRFIDKVREMGGRVLVHCLAGISRSPTVVISYVMKYLHLHYDEAYRYVKTRRPTISPNINFVGQLLELDLLLFGSRSFCRSPPGTLCPEPEINTSCRGASSTGSALLSKSSSSPCIESFDDVDFPFYRNRSLPSLRLKKSVEEAAPSSPSAILISPSLEVTSLLSNFNVGDDSRQPYVSDRLPSSPVFHEPGSAEYSAVLALCVDQALDGQRSWDQCQPIAGRPSSARVKRVESGDRERTQQHREVKEADKSTQVKSSGSRNSENGEEADSYQSQVQGVPERREAGDTIYRTVVSKSLSCPGRGDNSSSLNWTELQAGADEAVPSPSTSKTTPQENNANPFADSLALPSKDPPRNVEISPTSSTTAPKEEESRLSLTKGAAEVPPPAAPPPHPDKFLETGLKSIDGERVGTHYLQHCKPFLFPPAAAPAKKEGHFASDNNNNSSCSPQQETVSSFPPKTAGKSHPSRKAEPPYLPRSHSSSETYLNRRTRLERQAAATSGGANTRKSFSSDEVGRGFQSLCLHSSIPPPTTAPQTAAYHMEAYTNAMELARCDSWSTSGLGSEISDWDSIQGDIQSAVMLEDAQGPFEAVFSEVFPGEGQSPSGLREPPFKKLSDRCSSKTDGKIDKLNLKFSLSREEDFGDTSCTSSKSGGLPTTEDPLVTCPTPRPISLPGVSGTYNMTDPNANVDMGVGLEESGEWPKVDEEGLAYSPSVARKHHILVEHPPVSPRTMGEDVKYIMTWYKIDSCPQQTQALDIPSEGSSSAAALFLLEESGKHEIDLGKSENTTTKEQQQLFPLPQTPSGYNPLREDDKGHPTVGVDSLEGRPSTVGVERPPDTDGDAAMEKQSSGDDTAFSRVLQSREQEGGCLQERWHWWDTRFKEKIKNIQKNVSLTSWDSVSGDEGGLATDNMAGFHLAEELMQSMEDLLEREIRDIKERASALSSKFGLPVSCCSSSSTRTNGGSAPPIPPSEDEGLPPLVFGHDTAHPPKEYPLPKPLFRRENGLRGVSPFTRGGDPLKGRARSEPPLCMEEGLYRVKSCPGIAQGEGAAGEGNLKSMPREGGVVGPACSSFRFPRLFLSRSGSSKRFSCSALDFLSQPPPHFESSCPDVRETATGGQSPAPFSKSEAGGGGGGGSPSASSIRLLKVS